MIQVHVRMLSSPEQHVQIERSLRSRVGPTRALRGCLDCRVYREVGGEGALVFVELWDDQAAWQRHALSDSFREVLVLAELSPEPPEIAFRRIDASWGLAYLAELQRKLTSCTVGQPERDR